VWGGRNVKKRSKRNKLKGDRVRGGFAPIREKATTENAREHREKKQLKKYKKAPHRK